MKFTYLTLFFLFSAVLARVFFTPDAVSAQKSSARVSVTPAKKPSKIAMPAVKEAGVYFFRRDSDNPDSSGIDQPPYNYFEIVNGFFGIEPKVGEEVSVVPLQADFEPFSLKTTKIVKADFTDCNAEPPGTVWEVEFEKVTRKDFLEISSPTTRNGEYPFDVFLIYPKVKYAKRIKPAELKKTMLPKKVYLNTVTAAIDLTNDGLPDLLETSYCCRDPKQSAESCDYTCGAVYKKIKNRWKAIKYNSSCT